jgi:hypothetical protein
MNPRREFGVSAQNGYGLLKLAEFSVYAVAKHTGITTVEAMRVL